MKPQTTFLMRSKLNIPTIEWHRIVALRNIVVHRYFGIDIDIIWDIVQHRVPELLEQIQHVLEQEQSNQSDAT